MNLEIFLSAVELNFKTASRFPTINQITHVNPIVGNINRIRSERKVTVGYSIQTCNKWGRI